MCAGPISLQVAYGLHLCGSLQSKDTVATAAGKVTGIWALLFLLGLSSRKSESPLGFQAAKMISSPAWAMLAGVSLLQSPPCCLFASSLFPLLSMGCTDMTSILARLPICSEY